MLISIHTLTILVHVCRVLVKHHKNAYQAKLKRLQEEKDKAEEMAAGHAALEVTFDR